MQRQQNIAILGSTGSIGTQTLDIIRQYPDRFRAHALTARSNWELLAKQALEFKPSVVAISNESHLPSLRKALEGSGVECKGGSEVMAEIAALESNDTVVTATVGYSGFEPTIAAIRAGKRIALANKETLVAGGELIMPLLKEHGAEIVPVDSEHSAIFQCLVGEDRHSLRKIILTASGGPFRTTAASRLHDVTAADALRHPNWEMGAKVTIDSASMMNKGFEMMEARWLFDCPPERIEIAVHPQSIVHSMVEFHDGSVKAQLGLTDMHLPIRYALGYPERLVTKSAGLSLEQYSKLEFEAPDMDKFPLLRLAYEAIGRGGNIPCALNAANEVAVDAFLHGKIRFTEMPRIAEKTIAATPYEPRLTLSTIIATNGEALAKARELI